MINVTPDILATTFLAKLRADIGAENFRLACERNAAETNDSVCHSHDFCDANMIMVDALHSHGIETETETETRCIACGEYWPCSVVNNAKAYRAEIVARHQQSASADQLWNDAWSIAFRTMALEGQR